MSKRSTKIEDTEVTFWVVNLFQIAIKFKTWRAYGMANVRLVLYTVTLRPKF